MTRAVFVPTNEEIELLRLQFSYDPVEGHIYSLKCRKVRKCPASNQGYVYVSFNGRTVGGHRVAWLLMTGEWPPLHIDHVNGVKSDNRWCNLRLATHVQNCWNKPAPSNKGTYHCPDKRGSRKWRSAIEVNNKRIHLGYFRTREEAEQAYLDARDFHYGEFARAA